MPELISKVQHKTYEKGEFSDEKARSIEDTIILINDFPWDAERPLTDIQLTGPSITICDEDINYLKIGLYFNGKYCLYYLDNENHLYEYHAPTMDDACKIVTDYFSNQLSLEPFEKHLFNIGNKPHFITQYFEYRTKPWRAVMLTGFVLIYFFVFLLLSITSILKNGLGGVTLIFAPFILCMGYILARIYYFIYANRNCYLQISKGNPFFQYGFDEDNIQTYNKADIQEVEVFQTRGSRNPNFFVIYNINLKGGETLKLSNILISDSEFKDKFSPDLIKFGKKAFIWEL